MKIKLLLSFLLISFGISTLVAQKAKSKSSIISVQKVKLKDYDPTVGKYNMKEYYSVEKNILMPAKGMQMWYSKKYGQFFILNAEADVNENTISAMFDKGDKKDIGNDHEFGCLGCRRDSKCVVAESMGGETTYCANPCRRCDAFVTTKKDDAREFQTSGGDWNNISDNW